MKKTAICLLLILSAGILWSLDDSDLFYQAERKFEAGDYAAALTDYEDLIRQYPLSSHLADAQYRRAVTLFRLDRTEESLKLFLRIRERFSGGMLTQPLSFWLGTNYYVLHNYPAAVKELSDYLQAYPQGTYRREALLTLTFAQYRNGDSEAALKTALALSDTGLNISDEPQALAVIFSLFLKFGEYERLIRFSETYDLDTLPPEFRDEMTYYRGEAFYRLKEYEKAEKDFLQCLESDSGQIAAGAAERLFSLYRIQRKYSALNRLMQTAEERFSDKPEVLNVLRLKYGVEKFKQKRYKEAIVSLNRIWVAQDESSVDDLVPLYLAQSFAAEGETARAFEILSEYSSRIKGDRKLFLFLTARYGAEQERWEAVESAAAELLQLDSGAEWGESAAYFLVLAQVRQKKFDEAKKSASDAETRMPALKGQQRFVQLKLEISEATGDLSYSVQSLDQYLKNGSDDDKAVLTYLRQNFKAKNYQNILDYTAGLIGDRPKLKTENPPLESFVRYMRALSSISLKQYQAALTEFRLLTPEILMRNGWQELVPYYHYYRGWAYYRTGNYTEALKDFSTYSTGNPRGEFFLQALYLSGWCAYSLEEYEKAADIFLRYSEKEKEDSRYRAALMAGKSLAAAGANDKAESIFSAVASAAPRRMRTEALYEYALLMERTGFFEKSADIFMLIFKEDPQSEEAEGALLRAAEIWQERKQPEKSILAYTDFTAAYPQSPLRLQALASLAEILYDEKRYRESSQFLKDWTSADTEKRYEMRRLLLRARLATALKAWDEASQAWNELQRRFPDEAKARNAAHLIAKLYFLKQGQSDEEAELSLQFGKGGGLESPEGRQAAVGLAALHFREHPGKPEATAESDILLRELIRKYPSDIQNASSARFWLGWKLYEEKNYDEAFSFLIEAVSSDGSADYVPEALFKAGMCARASGRNEEAAELFSRLKIHFPQSEWVRRIPDQRRRP